MRDRLGLRVLLTLVVAVTIVYGSYMGLHTSKLPFGRTFLDANTMQVTPRAGVAFPAGLKPGDVVDLTAMPLDVRFALYTSQWDNIPGDKSYQLAVRRDGGLVQVSVTPVPLEDSAQILLTGLPELFVSVIFGIIALILLWRSHQRAAWMMALWGVAYSVAIIFEYVPVDGVWSLVMLAGARAFYLLGRFFFYLMAEAMVGPALSPRSRLLFRGAFGFMFLTGSAWAVGLPLWMAYSGALSELSVAFSLFYSFIYVVPTAMFFMSYRRAEAETRTRLRWMLWSSVLFLLSVSVRNLGFNLPLGYEFSYWLYSIALFLSLLGFLYAVLRHRVVDVSVAIDRTLVYGGMTTLVAGLLAAVNSLALRATLGEGASLLLQVVVPLSLGILLVKVRTYMDMAVERVFFRRRYLAEQALRSFARRCGHIGAIGHLFEAAAKEIRKQTGSPGVALYAQTEKGYVCMQQLGDIAYPATVDQDDAALVATRAELRPVDLVSLDSKLGADGCVFPMIVLGLERGVIVCANRPGERYPSDERAVLSQVANDVGAAWRILRARENEEFVRTVAAGQLDLAGARSRAQALEHAWAGA